MQEGSLVQVDGSVSRSHPFRLTGLVRHQMLGPRGGGEWAEGEKKIDRCLDRFCRATLQNVYIFVSTDIPKVNVENCFV